MKKCHRKRKTYIYSHDINNFSTMCLVKLAFRAKNKRITMSENGFDILLVFSIKKTSLLVQNANSISNILNAICNIPI